VHQTYATKVEWLKPCTSISFFRLLRKLWKGKNCDPAPLHRFFSLMRKMRARAYVIEKLESNPELSQEQEMASQRCGGAAKITQAIRLTFFASLPRSRKWEDETELPEHHLLGYAVILTLTLPHNTLRTFLLEAVVQTPGVAFKVGDKGAEDVVVLPVPNYYVHNARSLATTLGPIGHSRHFLMTAANFFTQQNDLTSVCAHAALRMAVNSSDYMSSLLGRKGLNKLTNKYINDVLGLDFSQPQRTIGHFRKDDGKKNIKEGLTYKDIRTVVESLGARLFVINFLEEQSVEYDELMYPLVESRCPTILEVQGWDSSNNEQYSHGLAVMGHTLNSDRWAPEANIGYGQYPPKKYIAACEWVCHYVIGDDNYGMHITLPSDMIRNDIVPYKNPNLHAIRVMSIVPKEVSVVGYKAQKIAMDIASILIRGTRLPNKGVFWLNKLKEIESRKRLVCRTLLIQGHEYASFMNQLENDRFIKPLQSQREFFKSLPKYVWITEVTIPNLYSGNKTKLGDVVIDACASEKQIDNYNCFVMAWFPGFIRHRQEKQSEFWYLKKHVPLIRTGPEGLIEW